MRLVIHRTEDCTEELNQDLQVQIWCWLLAFTLIDAVVIWKIAS